MEMTEDLDPGGSLRRIAALIAEKRRARAQLSLGSIDEDSHAARVRAADAEMAREWEVVRRHQVRSASDQSQF